MSDKTSFGISEELRQYIEALVKEVVLKGNSFENQKKWLQRYSINEGVDYNTLEKSLMMLFATAKEIESHDSSLAQAACSEITGWSKSFLEQLRLAYCRKDMAFLQNVFSPNSQIITGAYVLGKDIRYRSQGKRQYLANLRYIFVKNKIIDVTFGTDNVTGLLYESADGKCQIVRLLQHWHSDNYTDRGYVSFLIYDNQDGPKVLIRTWRPVDE